MTFKKTLPLFAVCGLLFLACDAGEEGGGNQDETGTDGDSETGDTGDDPLITWYDDIDCDGAGNDPDMCDARVCMHEDFYISTLAECHQEPTVECQDVVECYDEYIICITTACPLGTLEPEDKSEAGIYLCEEEKTNCTLYAGQD